MRNAVSAISCFKTFLLKNLFIQRQKSASGHLTLDNTSRATTRLFQLLVMFLISGIIFVIHTCVSVGVTSGKATTLVDSNYASQSRASIRRLLMTDPSLLGNSLKKFRSRLFQLRTHQRMSKKIEVEDAPTQHQYNSRLLPQILRGASSSSRIGCERKISRDFKHSPRTSA
jgi:hypothetical protein